MSVTMCMRVSACLLSLIFMRHFCGCQSGFNVFEQIQTNPHTFTVSKEGTLEYWNEYRLPGTLMLFQYYFPYLLSFFFVLFFYKIFFMFISIFMAMLRFLFFCCFYLFLNNLADKKSQKRARKKNTSSNLYIFSTL